MTKSVFQKKIYAYYEKQKRSLPWRTTRDPYKILVSEIMLQQTQASRVVPKYFEFIKKFPNVKALSHASIPDVLKLWQGLGYNRRALMLHKLAIVVSKEYSGKFPKDFKELQSLPGIGPYTASAVCAFAYNMPVTMIETNIRTVFIHFFFRGAKKVPDTKLIPLIEKYQDTIHPREWYNALMDYGAMLKQTMPNPSRKSAHHVTQPKFKGSNRQVRGAIIKAYTSNTAVTKNTLIRTLPYEKKVIIAQYEALEKEGFFV